MEFYEYKMTSDALCMGERMKAGIFRPCARTIRYSQISGALRRVLGDGEIHAAGYLVGEDSHNIPEYLIYSPRDRVAGISKVPLQIEILTNVEAKVFVLKNAFTEERLAQNFELTIGALISKGLGHCLLSQITVHRIQLKDLELGELRIRIPEKFASLFGIRKVLRPIYGYLFEPISVSEGVYVRSLFEGSFVAAPEIFIKRRKGD